MSASVRNLPQRRRSLGPVSPKRIYRSLSVKLRGGDSGNEAGHSEWRKRLSRGARNYTCLWEALECEDTLAVQHLLSRERTTGRETDGERDRQLNSVSEMGLVPLDVAVFTHNPSLLQVLLKAGARHNPTLNSASDWLVKLDQLVSVAEQRLEDWRAELRVKVKAGLQSEADAEKNVQLWTQRHELYTRMRETFHMTALPGSPSHVALLVTGDSCLSVSVQEPCRQTHGLITRYRVEWSSSSSFTPLCGSAYITDMKNPVFNITGLKTGVQYFVRVSVCNVRGWGPPQVSSPLSAAPSSWRECSGVRIRSKNQEAAARMIFQQIKEPTYRGYCTESVSSSRRVSVSRGLKQLFQTPVRFVRLLQRGVYLVAVFYQKDNILVTADDQLPLVEIQCCSTSVMQDFLWLAKLSCAWQQVPWLQKAMSSSLSSSSSRLQNRHSILRAVAQLQVSVGCVDLGQVYFEPVKDRQGNVLLVTMREVTTPVTPSDPPLHWTPLSRLQKQQSSSLLPEPTAIHTLTEQLKEKLSYHRRSLQRAQAGLYVGILKLCSSVDQLRVLVPHKLPNMLYHCRIRNRPHVSREEWAWIQTHGVGGASESGQTANGSVEGGDEVLIDGSGVEDFVRSFRTAVIQLLTKLNIPLYRACHYRVYTHELLQLGDQASLILLLPPSEEFSSSHWPLEGAVEHGFTMPLTVFELVHLWAYNRELLSQYCQAWVRLELDACLSQQALREALDSREVMDAKDRLTHITQLSQNLGVIWRDSRWLMEVIQAVRSKQCSGSVSLGRVMHSRSPIKIEEQTPPETHTHSTEDTQLSSSDQPERSKVTAPVDIPGVTNKLMISETPLTSAQSDHVTDPCYHGNNLHHIHSCPELSVSSSADAMSPEGGGEEEEADEGGDVFSGVMDLLDRLDLRGESFLDLRQLDLTEPALQTQSAAGADGAVPLQASGGRSLPVRSLVEWVNSANQQL